MWRLTSGVCAGVVWIVCAAAHGAPKPAVIEPAPLWAFPAAREGPAPVKPPPPPGETPVKAPPNTAAVDLYPDEHPLMPPAVRGGGEALGCGLCHLPTGGGRSENMSLAGLPYAYLRQQWRDMKSGAREFQPDYAPDAGMSKVVRQVSNADAFQGLRYFSRLRFVKRVKVVEASTIPAAVQASFVYKFDATAPTQLLGERIIEGPDDFDLFEKRDPHGMFTAYVPLGAIARGAKLARGTSTRPSCASCHGVGLRGGPVGPPIAGRFPTGLFRQLYAFKIGSRNGAGAQAMKPIVAHLAQADMIDLAAYVGSRRP
jgi:cytochrome c553